MGVIPQHCLEFVFFDSVVLQLTDDMDAGHLSKIGMDTAHWSETSKYINIKILIKLISFIVKFLLFIFRKQRTTLELHSKHHHHVLS